MSDLQAMASNWHVPVSEGTIKQIVGEGQSVAPEKANAFEEYLKTAAQGLYPTLAPQLKAGIPTTALLDPYRQVGKQILGEGFEPNFQTDPKVRAALEGGVDPQTGRAAPMSLTQWTQHLKSEPTFGWLNSEQGQAEYQTMLDRIHQALMGGQ
jgi:hypothetical protein